MSLDPVTALLDVGSKVIDRLWPDPAQASAAKLELYKLQQSGELAQITGQLAINQEEAKNPSVWVSGWRPGIGWCCVAACSWNWLGLPIAKFGLALAGHPLELSPADLGEMWPILGAMLGIGSLRTIEKVKGAESNR